MCLDDCAYAMWHLHYDDLIRHKIFKFLISAYFFNLII